MPNRRESQDERLPPKQDNVEQSKARVRIGRACDRCKARKSKCDGNIPCSGCVASDSICEYSARRRREARDWYLGMQDVIDEALQKLYWACRGGRGFPGVIPDESSGRVSTEAILQGLGLHPPAVERLGLQASQSDSILDGVQSSSGRSYQRPDLRMDNLQRASTASSGQTPLSMPSDDQNALTDGSSVTAAGRRHTRRTPIEHEAERRRAGLEQPYPGTVESPIDPLMLQNGDLDPMDANFAMYPEAIAMESESRPQLDSQEGHGSARRGRGRGRGRGQTQQQTVQEDGFGPSNQAQWRRESAHTDGETLPWPGTLAAVYQDTNPRNDGAGFNEQNRRQ